jgi:hypothetical protein
VSVPGFGGAVGLAGLDQGVEAEGQRVKSSEEIMEILEAFDLTGGLRAAAALAQPHTNSRSPRARHSPPNS